MKVNKNGQKAGLVKSTGKAGSEVRAERGKQDRQRNGRNVTEKTPAVASGVHTPRASQGQTGAKSKSVERSRATTGALAALPAKTSVNKADAEVKSPKGVKRKTDPKVASVSASVAKTDLDLKAKKVKKQDNKVSGETTSSLQHQKATPDKKVKNNQNKKMPGSSKSDKKSFASKSTPKADGKGKVKKTAVLKVSKKIFSSKPKKRALNSTGTGVETESCNRSSSQDNKKADTESKTVKNVNKPKTELKDSSVQLNQVQAEGKIKKRKLDKKTLAKRKLSRMKKLGYLSAPPRRSAALNASAIMNCIFDKTVLPKPIKIKVEPDSEEEIEDDQALAETLDSDSDHDDGPEKLTDSSHNKINDDNTAGRPSSLLSEKHQPTKKDRKVNKKKSRPRKRKKSEVSDEMSELGGGGRRMASLNASAMLHASFGREEKRSRRDPLTIAIEASLRDLQEKEKKEHKEEISEICSENIPSSSNATSDNIKSSQKNLISKTSQIKTDLKESIKTEKKESSSLEVKHEKKEKSKKSLKSSLEGLSELDIRTQLIESAKIKSKISRQSSEEKIKKKLKKSQQEKNEEKTVGKASSDLMADQGGSSGLDIKLELLPGVEKISKLERTSSKQQVKSGLAGPPIHQSTPDSKPKLEIQHPTLTTQTARPQQQIKVETSPRTIITGVKPRPALLPPVLPPNKRYQPPPQPPILYSSPSLLVTSSGSSSTPTATVQPTLVSLPSTAKPVIGTVSPQNFSSSTFQTFPNMGSAGAYPTNQGYSNSLQYPSYPYSQQYQYQGKPDQYGGGGGYFIAGGAVPPYHGAALVPVTTTSGSGFPPASAAIYGPYSYGPYGAGRVIGPIIAIGNIAPGPDSRPQGKAVPMMATASTDPALFRQILPKGGDSNKVQPSVSITPSASLRPMQIVGPIAAVLPTPVQAMPSLSITSMTTLTSSTSTSTTVTKIVTAAQDKRLSSGKAEKDPHPQPVQPVIVNHVMVPPQPAPPKPVTENIYKNIGENFSKSKLNLENRVKEIHMKNTLSRSQQGPPASGTKHSSNLTSFPKSKSATEILNIPAQISAGGNSKNVSESPIVTVTIRNKAGTKDPLVIKRPKDWKEVVKAQSIVSKSPNVLTKSKSSSNVTPLRVPRPSFQYLDSPKQNLPKLSASSYSAGSQELPTFHIPHKSENSPSAEAKGNAGHPGLPCGLQRMTSSLIHNSKSPTKMTLKEMKRIPSKILDKPMSILTPLSVSEDSCETSDQPPKLSPQISLEKERSSSPALSRSRLQLKPATSPKLDIEQYLTVSKVSRKSGLATSPAPSQPQPEKKKRESLGKKGFPAVPVLIPWSKRNKEPPKKSGGWSWKGDSFVGKVHLNNEELPVERICYQSMRHEEGDEEVSVKDCILLASGNRKKDLPYIAKVSSLWENPEDGEMMMSLLWFYRPEHTDIGRQADDCKDEVFASKHRDFTSVACIEDKCFVMTFNEYCRYMRFSRMVDSGVTPAWNIVPDRRDGYPRAPLLPTCQVANDRVFLCRKVYDPRGRRMYKNPY